MEKSGIVDQAEQHLHTAGAAAEKAIDKVEEEQNPTKELETMRRELEEVKELAARLESKHGGDPESLELKEEMVRIKAEMEELRHLALNSQKPETDTAAVEAVEMAQPESVEENREEKRKSLFRQRR